MKKNIYLFYVSNNVLWRSFPNSLLSLCNPLRDGGFDPRIIDTVLEERGTVEFEDPLFVGFSIYTDANISRALKIAAAVRQRYPSVPLVWGGPHAIMMPEQTAGHPLVDFVCYGEGEIAVVELANALARGARSFENVRGIIWKNAAGTCVRNEPPPYVDLDSCRLYPYDVLNQRVYNLSKGKVYYEASRGCPYACRFCSYDHKQWRFRSSRMVIEDLTKVDEMFSPREVQVVDANHFMKLDWVEQIWAEKIKRRLAFRWESNCRFDTLARMDERLLKIVASSGCYQLRLGAESGSQKILEYLNKGITVDQIIVGIRRCLEHNINPLVSFMMGYPHEDEKDIEATISLIDRIRRDFPRAEINGLFQFQPYPNTRIFDDIRKQYSIPQPRSLDGWSIYQIVEMHRSDFPWLDNRLYERYKVLNSIVSYIFFSDKLRHMPLEQRDSIPVLRNGFFFDIFLFCDTIFRRVFVRLRWDKKNLIFPVEWHIWDLLRKYVLRMF